MSNKLKELCKQNNELEKNINEENMPLYTDMICYIRSANISSLNQEMVRRDLGEMLLSAQIRGENITDVIGKDLKEFCDEVILNLPARTQIEKWIDRFDIIFFCISILGTISIVFSKDFRNIIINIISKKTVNYNIGVSIGMIISIFVIMIFASLIIEVISKNSLKKESSSKKSKKVIVGGIIGGLIMAVIILIWKFGSKILFSINIFLAFAILFGFFIVHKVLSKI